MDGRQELLAYLVTSIGTVVVLFGLQEWYATYLDVAVVHAQHADEPSSAKLAAVRAGEQAKLSSGALPIEQAKRALAQRGRLGFPRIAPQASADVSAMSGWIHQPGFKGYEPRTPPAPVAEPQAVAAESQAPADGAATAEPGTRAPVGELRK
jgi:hypothetical protein